MHQLLRPFYMFNQYMLLGENTRQLLTKYVSHIRIVFFTLISRISKQFIQRKANCINSTFSDCKCAKSEAKTQSSIICYYKQTNVEFTIYTGNEFSHAFYASLNTGLCKNIIVLYAIQKACKTPEGVSLNSTQYTRWE